MMTDSDAKPESPTDAGTVSQDQMMRELAASVKTLAQRPRGQALGFIVSQVLMVAVAVASVYIAAREGLVQAVKFDQYQTASRMHNALETIRHEIDVNRPVIEANLVELRKMLLARLRSSLESREDSIVRLVEETEKLRERLANETSDRGKERLESQIAGKIEARAKMQAEAERMQAKVQHYRYFFDEEPELRAMVGDEFAETLIDTVQLQPLRMNIWENISGQDFLYEMDAGFVFAMSELDDLAKGLSQRLPGQQKWDELNPLEVKQSIWDATRREDALIRMQQLIDETIIPWLQEEAKRLRAVMKVDEAVDEAISSKNNARTGTPGPAWRPDPNRSN